MRDDEAAFDREIAPLLEQVRAICQRRGMPYALIVGFDDGFAEIVSVNMADPWPLAQIGQVLARGPTVRVVGGKARTDGE